MSITSSRLRLYPRALLVLLTAGLLVRLTFVAFHQRPLISDEKEFDQLAFNIATTGSYSYDGTPTAYRPVGYPAFVALVYLAGGRSPITVKLLQALLDALTGALLFHLLRKKGERRATCAAGIWLLFPPAILYTNLLMSETLFTFLVAAVVLLLQSVDSRPLRNTLLAGFVIGVSILIRSNFLLFALLLPLLTSKIRIRWKTLGTVVLAALLTIAPWLIRNLIILGTPVLATNGGINLLIGNNPGATGGYAVTYSDDILAGAESEVEADRRALAYAMRFIAENPVTFLTNGAKKMALFFSSEGGLLVWSFHGTPDDHSIRFASKYASIPIVLILLVNLPYIVILLSGATGLFSADRDRLWWSVMLLLTSWLVTHALFFGGSRFHFPLMPFFACFGAAVLTDPALAWGTLSKMQKVTLGSLVLLLLLVWLVEATVVFDA